MPDPMDLKALGIRLFAGWMLNHDYLWFSSTEISKAAITLPYIHNYALTYAVAGFSYGIVTPTTPQYASDLSAMDLYCTPAEGLGARSVRITQNAINDLTGRTDDGPSGRNTPNLGWRVALSPTSVSSATGMGVGFRFYCFTFDGITPRAVTRLGKKGCPVRIVWEEIDAPVARFVEEAFVPTHLVNPLDVGGTVLSYEPISIPPHLLLRHAAIGEDWVVRAGGHGVHVPVRVLERAQS